MREVDPQVIRAAARGDLGAFEELVRSHQTEVWRFLRHLVRDPGLAEDLTQETFLRVYRRLGGFRFQSSFSTWVFAIARNAGIDALRARTRDRALLEALGPPPPSLGDGVDGGMGEVEVREAVGSLPLRLRESFALVEVLGLTYRETGQALGVPEGTVKSRVHHARRQLIAWLAAGERSSSPQGDSAVIKRGGAADAL